MLIHEYVALDMGRVLEALARLDSIDRFVEIVAKIESEAG